MLHAASFSNRYTDPAETALVFHVYLANIKGVANYSISKQSNLQN
jgi:hypothetical protein